MTLGSKLASILEKFNSVVPAPKRAIMEGHIEMLKNTDAAGKALNVGDIAPIFKLKNQNDEIVSSNELLRNGPLVVSFYRGSWCPYCVEEVKALNEAYDSFREAGADLVVISPQALQYTQKQAEDSRFKFSLLVDTGNKTGREFGLTYTLPEDLADIYMNAKANLPLINESDTWELPIPARYVIDRSGKIIYAKIDPDYHLSIATNQLRSELVRWKRQQLAPFPHERHMRKAAADGEARP